VASRDVIVAFDDIVHGSASVYSSAFVNLALAELERYALEVVVDPVGTPPDNFTVQLEMSSDGRNWIAKNGPPEVYMLAGAIQTYVASGFDSGLIPALALVRVRVQLAGASSAAHVKVFVRQGPRFGFVPPGLSGCVLWLRSDTGLTMNGANVSAWADLSGNGNNASQGASTRQPAFNTRQINGQPSLFFDPSTSGSEKYMNLSNSLASLSALHAFVVHRRLTATESNNAKTGFWKLGTAAGAAAMPGTDGNIYDDCGSTASHACGAPVVTLTTSQVYEVTSQSGSWANGLNGVAQFSTASNTVGGSSTAQIGGNSGFGNFYNGDWAEMILFNRILATPERALVIGYLNGRYALGAV